MIRNDMIMNDTIRNDTTLKIKPKQVTFQDTQNERRIQFEKDAGMLVLQQVRGMLESRMHVPPHRSQ